MRTPTLNDIQRTKTKDLKAVFDSQVYHTPLWRQLTAQVKLEQPLCVMCAVNDIDTPTKEIDHIIPTRVNKALWFERSNLQGLCKSCHSTKSMRDRKTYP
jgi:5-methylcytosine-specific restriction protein A